MIVYDLRCQQGHVFEAWFPNDDAFDLQAKGGKVACPTCGARKVEKAIMAPSVAVKARDPRKGDPRKGPQRRVAASNGPGKEKVEAALKALREEVEKNLDYVGAAFPEEARKIHYGEREQRGIYGETSLEEAKALEEEGVAIQALPFPVRSS